MHTISNEDLADILIERKIIGVDFGPREITLHLQGGPLNDGNESVTIQASTNDKLNEPAWLTFERIT